jgi:hypothetical protein
MELKDIEISIEDTKFTEEDYQEMLAYKEELLQEYKRKLNIATSALQYYAEGTLGSSVAEQALKEMEEV